jgi:hypothetical protein
MNTTQVVIFCIDIVNVWLHARVLEEGVRMGRIGQVGGDAQLLLVGLCWSVNKSFFWFRKSRKCYFTGIVNLAYPKFLVSEEGADLSIYYNNHYIH